MMERAPWDIRGKTVLITGGTDGIGKATALALLKQGAYLVLTSRSREKGDAVRRELVAESGNPNVEVLMSDLSSLSSVRECAEAYVRRFKELHVLINNAGVMPTLRHESKDGIELNFAVNFLAPALLTRRLLPLLVASAPARIINVISQLYAQAALDLDDLELKRTFSRYRAYANSKLALLLFTRALADELRGTTVTVNALHPGVVRTTLALEALEKSNPLVKIAFPFLAMSSPKRGAKTGVFLATSNTVGNVSGKYFVNCKEREAHLTTDDLVRAPKLLSATEEQYLAPYLR